MAIRNIAHAIKSKEISLGVAVGVENMTLKYVPLQAVNRLSRNGQSVLVQPQRFPKQLTAMCKRTTVSRYKVTGLLRCWY